MTTRDICFTPAVELAAMIRDGEVSSLEVVQAVLDRIERLNPLINAYCTVVADRALDEARAADTAIAGARRPDRCTGCPCPSRTWSPRKASARPTVRPSSRTGCRTTTRRWWSVCGPPGQ